MTAADWIKFTPGWLAFAMAVGTLVLKWTKRRHQLAAGPDTAELRAQLVELRPILELVLIYRIRADFFKQDYRWDIARVLQDSAARRTDQELSANLERLADIWLGIFNNAPLPREPTAFTRDVRGETTAPGFGPVYDEEEARSFQEMAGLAGEGLTVIASALRRMNELERRTFGRS